jgi:hypothetical protein
MKQWELEDIYEALDQLQAHASHTIGFDHAKRIAEKANRILRKEFEGTGKIEPEPEPGDYIEEDY